LSIKEKRDYYKFTLNNLCLLVTSSVAVFEAAIRVKSMCIIQSWFKTRKGRNYGNIRNVYINLHLKTV